MRKRATVLSAMLVTLAGFVVPLVGAPAQATSARPGAFPGSWCNNQPPPCVVSATRNGVALSENDPTYVVSAYGSLQTDGEFLTQWQFSGVNSTVDGQYASLPSTDIGVPFSVTIDVGAHTPRVLDEYAGGVSVTKTEVGGSWDVTVSGTAVEQGVNNDCDWTSWTCPTNDNNWITVFFGEIGDWQQWPDPAQWNDFNGLDQWTNVEMTDLPPQISGNPFAITEELGNSQTLSGQAFDGFWDGVLPNAVLVDMGINDPSTLTPTGVSASVGTGTVTVTPGPTSTEIAMTGVTFLPGLAAALQGTMAPPRFLHIKRGSITPYAPTRLTTRRASATVAYLSFRAARPRGSYVRSYEGRCYAKNHTTRYTTGPHSSLTVTSLTRGVAYSCQVRAKASVGYGSWGPSTKLAA